jgi:hypothetical protein
MAGAAAAPMASSAGASPSTASDLLPESGDPGRGQLCDAMAALYALELGEQSSDTSTGKTEVQNNHQRADDALRNEIQARQRQQHDSGGDGFFRCIGRLIKDFVGDLAEGDLGKLGREMKSDVAACDNPQFWSDLEAGAKVVAAVAAAAATIVSCGTLGPVVVGVAVGLSAAGFAVQQTNCLGGASQWVGLACQLASAVVTCGASLAASGTMSAVALTAEGAANGTAGAATVVAGAAHMGVTGFQADAERAEADAVHAQSQQQLLARIDQWTVDALQEQSDSHRGAMTALSGAIEANEQASLAAAPSQTRG